MDPVTLPPAAVPALAKNKLQVQRAAKEFEAMFMTEMLNHMYTDIETDGPFGGGHGEEVFRSFMIEQYGRMVADSGNTKISDTLAREMLRMQEAQQSPNGNLRQYGE